ncbi:MAG: hypothetical protein ACTSQO_00750 [Candidatus Helarchaeota archaeon]
MPINTFGDIPDDFPTKSYLPLGPNIWEMFKDYGWEWLQYFFREFGKTIGDLAKIRLTESIYTARDIVSGKIDQNISSKILTYCFFPPTMAIRADLQQGTMKLLFGDSSDTTFLFLNDFDRDVLFALNTHIEDGYPIDYWHIISGEDDDFFDRRHMKLGYKFRDIPKRSKNLDQAANRLIDVLKDARNERTPQWTNSAYYIIITWCSAGLNMVLENSNIETIGCMFDGIASKLFYGLKDFWFNFFPIPTFLGSMQRVNRKKFLKMFSGLTSESHLYLQPIESEAHPLINKIVPECFEFMKKRWDKGIILPWQSLERKIPNLKKVKKESDFMAQYPNDPDGRLKHERLGISFDDSLKGVYLNVNFETKNDEIDQQSIISMGHGRKTVFK